MYRPLKGQTSYGDEGIAFRGYKLDTYMCTWRKVNPLEGLLDNI